MEKAYRTETTIAEGGTLELHGLPFPPGEAVEVIVIGRNGATVTGHPLRGTVLRYDDPTGPVAERDWDSVG